MLPLLDEFLSSQVEIIQGDTSSPECEGDVSPPYRGTQRRTHRHHKLVGSGILAYLLGQTK